MATRKEQKEQLRAEREAAEAVLAAAAERRKRLYTLGAMAVAAAVIVVVVIAVTSGGGGSKATGIQTGTQKKQTQSGVTSLLGGIPQSGSTLGRSTAKVEMTYFGDLECPVCKEFTLGTMPKVISSFVRPGNVSVDYRALESATSDKNTFITQQAAALAAGKQKRMWQYVELFYHQQGDEGSDYVNEAYLDNLAKQIPGLNIAKWKSDRSDVGLSTQVKADEAAGNQIGATGTPTIVIQGPKGIKGLSGNVPYDAIASAIKAVGGSAPAA